MKDRGFRRFWLLVPFAAESFRSQLVGLEPGGLGFEASGSCGGQMGNPSTKPPIRSKPPGKPRIVWIGLGLRRDLRRSLDFDLSGGFPSKLTLLEVPTREIGGTPVGLGV